MNPIIVLLFLLAPILSLASEVSDYRIEPTASKQSRQLAKDRVSEGAWMAVPVPFANPTLGAGLQAAVLYMHAKTDPDTPNATSGVGGLYSDSESYFVGVFHDDYFQQDKYRFTFVYGYGDLNLDYYGSGSDSRLNDNPVEYNLKANGLYSKFLVRMPYTQSWYIGLRYMGSMSEVAFDLGQFIPSLPVIDGDIATSGLGLMLTYDSKNDNYYPTKGQSFNLIYSRDSEKLASDFEFTRFDLDYQYYWLLMPQHVLAFKAELKNVAGTPPFFMEPTLSMRGFDTSRYRDLSTASVHGEWRYKFADRWGMAVFAESGATASRYDELSSGRTVQSYGAGIRWQATEEKTINLGVDIAFSGSESAVYIRAGEAY
ncbi:MAG: BamA/TamA family outer membrane protein [Pseudomonadales bacterium]|nr:BamA/TamA family outer membrane protein [Pseudomonadales bacterium]